MANEDDIKRLADVLYAGITTGFSNDNLDQAMQAVGLPTDSSRVSSKVSKAGSFLRQYGYEPNKADRLLQKFYYPK
jgi:hypothetical protein